MKNIKIILTIAISVILLSLAATAADIGYIAVAVGRCSVVTSNGLTATLEPISDGNKVEDMFCVPVFVNENTYIPFEFVFKKMGIDVINDTESGSTVLERPAKKPILIYGLEKEATKCKNVELNGDNITFYPEKAAPVTEKVDVYTYLGRTYIAARYLEKFGILIKWEPDTSVVYISYGDSPEVIKNFEHVYYAETEEEKERALEKYFSKVKSSDVFMGALEQCLNTSMESSNNQNGGYIQPYNGKNFHPNIGITNDGWFTKIGEHGRNVCYALGESGEYMYYVERTTQTLRRYSLDEKIVDKNKDIAVKLPAQLIGKKITHVTYYDGNIIYLAYDNINDGGHIYMSRVGHEEKCTVKLTKDRAWNFYLTPVYKLYFVNYDEGYRLTSIDLRAIENTKVFVEAPFEGVYSDIRNFTPMQTFSFDASNHTDYYYIDIVTGSLIRSSRNYNTGVEVLNPGVEGAVRHFLNAAPVGGQTSVIYAEYPGGKQWDFSKSKIVLFNVETKKETVLYECDFAVNGLCFYNGKIYFTDTAYSALYQLENAGSNLKVKVTRIGE